MESHGSVREVFAARSARSMVPAVLRVPDIAAALAVSRATARRLCATGALPARRIGRAWAITRDAFLDALDAAPPCSDCSAAVRELGASTCPACRARLRAARGSR